MAAPAGSLTKPRMEVAVSTCASGGMLARAKAEVCCRMARLCLSRGNGVKAGVNRLSRSTMCREIIVQCKRSADSRSAAFAGSPIGASGLDLRVGRDIGEALLAGRRVATGRVGPHSVGTPLGTVPGARPAQSPALKLLLTDQSVNTLPPPPCRRCPPSPQTTPIESLFSPSN